MATCPPRPSVGRMVDLPSRVLVAGGGIAALEAMLALRTRAPHAVDVAVLAPDLVLRVPALSTAVPFGAPTPRAYSVPAACVQHGARLVGLGVASVDPQARTVTLVDGRERPYDALLVATGAEPVDVLGAPTLFRGLRDAERLARLADEVALGRVASVALVVPAGPCWPLPAYELALLLRAHAGRCGVPLAVEVVTPEPAPLALLGPVAAAAVAERLAAAGVALRAGVEPEAVEHGTDVRAGGEVVARADRVVALPRLRGRVPDGLPRDADGFVGVDEHGAVAGCPGVWAAGDVTDFPVKQGGIAALQAGSAAAQIARRAGADVPEQPLVPELRVKLVTGGDPLFLRAGGPGAPAAKAVPLWWPAAKVAAPHLATWLEDEDRRAGHDTWWHPRDDDALVLRDVPA
jgi:sulfide:quinone oxidoreductase